MERDASKLASQLRNLCKAIEENRPFLKKIAKALDTEEYSWYDPVLVKMVDPEGIAVIKRLAEKS